MQSETRTSQARPAGFWLGMVEVVVGVGLVVAGCGFAVRSDESLASVAAFYGLVAGVCFMVPGALMMRSSRGRWVTQLLPGLVMAWVFLSRFLE